MTRCALAGAVAVALAGCHPPTPPGVCSSPQSPHVASCSDPCCGDGLNPPTSGGHCAATLSCGIYTAEQLRCRWVHNIEHGHAVLLYNCPSGCPQIVADLEAIWNAQPVGLNGVRRILLAPDSVIPDAVAAVTFGHSWVGSTVDSAAIADVLSHQDEPGVPEPGLVCAP